MANYSKPEAFDWAKENVRGQWSTLMTPFTENDEIDENPRFSCKILDLFSNHQFHELLYR